MVEVVKDFREQLYEGYVSGFKGDAAVKDPGARSRYFAWCESRLYPHLDNVPASARVLKVGCGAGYFLDFLKNKGFSALEGIDTSSQQVELAKSRGVHVQRADVFEYLGEKHGAYDLIVAIDFVEHFHRHELVELADLFCAALKPGGKLLVQTPNGAGIFPWPIVYGDLTHITIFTPRSLEQLFRVSRFENFRFTESVLAPTTIKNRVKLAAWYFLKQVMMALRSLETTQRQEVWSQNIICSCNKGNVSSVTHD